MGKPEKAQALQRLGLSGLPNGQAFQPDSAPIRPKLTIQRIGLSVQLSWPAIATGYVLEQSDSLTAPNWVAGPAGNPVSISASQSARYYRLRK